MPTPRQDDLLSLLPPTLAEIHELFGLDVMLKLWRSFGGTHVYVAAKPKEDSPIVQCLGDNYKAFCQHYAGTWLIIPKATKLELQLRNRLICDAVTGGQTLAQVARRFGLAERQIQRITQAVKSTDQNDLFD